MDQPGQTRFARYQALAAQHELAPHYSDLSFLERYATKNHGELLRARAEILAELAEFHRDPFFIAFLKACAPHLFQWATWRARALQIAERLDVGELPPSLSHRKRTVEEVRSSMVQRERTKIGDQTAMAYVALEQIDELKDLEKSKIKEIAARDDLTDEEKDERIQGIKAMTQQRFTMMLMESTHHAENHQQTDTPPPAVILGQP